MADEMVLETQQWLNNNYGNVPGFEKVKEDGKTGWPTIYALIRALQHELGITELSDNFGTDTSNRFDSKIVPKLEIGYKSNVVRLIQYAFWCKGISPVESGGEFTEYTLKAIKELQSDAGFPNGDGKFTSKWAKALFDMSAFVLVSGGDKTVRTMQQWLNVNYNIYFGILPCDGIYQRATNTALIYALQSEEGLPPESEATEGQPFANGNYGNTTSQLTPTLQVGDSGGFVEILQYGLYVNGFYKKGPFNGNFTDKLATEISKFASFMEYDSRNALAGIADITTFKGLLISSGDTNRTAIGADTSTQLTPAQVKTLVDNGVKYVGRYLTGSVGSGSDERNKYLTSEEIDNILGSGLSIFPIYQDNYPEVKYFNKEQGISDAIAAAKAAIKLGVPYGTIIYFAVDVDVEDGDVAGTVIPYFEGVFGTLTGSGFRVGVYGTRNVCQRVIDQKTAVYAFVSDMSTGYSGNLGFAMPQDWAFDQFFEYTVGSGEGAVGIDQVGVSQVDLGMQYVYKNTSKYPDWFFQKLAAIGIIWPMLSEVIKATIELEQDAYYEAEPFHIYTELSEKLSIGEGDNETSFNISKGEISNSFYDQLKDFGDALSLSSGEAKTELYHKLGEIIEGGVFQITSAPFKEKEKGNVGLEIKIDFEGEKEGKTGEVELTIDVYMNKKTIDDSGDDDEKDAYDTLEKITNAKDSEVKSISAQNAFYAHYFSNLLEENTKQIVEVAILGILLAFVIKFGPAIMFLVLG